MLAECKSGNKKEADFGDLFFSPNEKTDENRNSNTIAIALQDLRDQAFYYALRYRFDPVLGGAHESYLNTLNSIISQLKV